MRRPLYGSNLAPKDDGGEDFAIVHCCDGKTWTRDWHHDVACSMAELENRLQGLGNGFCDHGELCLGWVVWKVRR